MVSGSEWQGAEAKVNIICIDGQQYIKKWRFPKTYRHPDLDRRLTKQRTAAEGRALARALLRNLPVPSVYLVDPEQGLLIMEYMSDSISIKELLATKACDTAAIAANIGCIIAQMHSYDIIHGDLTTSNILWQKATDKVYLIDFGLSCQSTLVENKAVDLYVLERACRSTHSVNHPGLFELIFRNYLEELAGRGAQSMARHMSEKLDEVRARGRKRE